MELEDEEEEGVHTHIGLAVSGPRHARVHGHLHVPTARHHGGGHAIL